MIASLIHGCTLTMPANISPGSQYNYYEQPSL